MEPSVDDIIAVTQRVTDSLLGTVAEPLADARTPERWEFTATVQICGPWHGAIAVAYARPVAVAITAAMFGADPGTTSRDEIDDAMGEVANMIGGNIKGLLPGPSHLSLPTVAEIADTSPMIAATELAVHARFALESGVLGVYVVPDDVGHRPHTENARPCKEST